MPRDVLLTASVTGKELSASLAGRTGRALVADALAVRPDGERLLAVNPARDALLQVEATPKGGARSPQEYLVATMKLQSLRDDRALNVNGLPAYAGVNRMQTPFGVRDAQVATVFFRDHAFRFFGAARDGTPAQPFLATVQSLHALKPDERRLAEALRIDLVTARTGDRYAQYARRSPLQHEPEAMLRLINDQYPQGEPAPGQLIKIIR